MREKIGLYIKSKTKINFVLITTFLVYLLSVKGIICGNDYSQILLTKSIVKRKSFEISLDEAIATQGDIALVNGKYYIDKPPGLSFLAVPMYFLGKFIGFPVYFAILTSVILGTLLIFLFYKLSLQFNTEEKEAITNSFSLASATLIFVYLYILQLSLGM